MKEPKSEAANHDGDSALASAHGSASERIRALEAVLWEALPLLEIFRDFEPGEPNGPCAANRAFALCECINGLLTPNDPSSATRPTSGRDCNRSVMAGFAAAHG